MRTAVACFRYFVNTFTSAMDYHAMAQTSPEKDFREMKAGSLSGKQLIPTRGFRTKAGPAADGSAAVPAGRSFTMAHRSMLACSCDALCNSGGGPRMKFGTLALVTGQTLISVVLLSGSQAAAEGWSFVIIINADNPADGVIREMASRMFSGKISKWS